ncbi:hypothetical protein HYPGJ_20990 [Hyphomicrobium sp. GJ21]|nr:hypothetical protein HYPGJ_20990 [Hyphomicrobium sp. GJ21]
MEFVGPDGLALRLDNRRVLAGVWYRWDYRTAG